MRFVVYGAGAVGGVLGGHLALQKHDVLLICRESHAQAIRKQKGLRLKSATGEYFANVDAAVEISQEQFHADTCVLFTSKSNHTEACSDVLAGAAPPETRVVSFQNGIANEEIIARNFAQSYGGVCRMTCSFLQPGQVSYRRQGRLIVGKYPKGTDAFAKTLAGILNEAGFDTAVSKNIMGDKWLKLAANLQSAFHAIIDSRDHDGLEFVDLKVGVLEEAKKILAAAKIRARSCDGRDASLSDLIRELKKPHGRRGLSSVKINNSTWQNLYLGRPELESGFFHGPIIALGREHGITVPFNEVALEQVVRCRDEKLGPGALRAAEILDMIRDRSA